MKRNKILIYGLIIISALVIMYAAINIINNTSAESLFNLEDDSAPDMLKPVMTGSTSNGDVAIELTPYAPLNNELRVRMSINTHSVELSQFDLKRITTLEYNGQFIKPIEAPDLDGHHIIGDIIFNIQDNMDKFTIRIKGIPAVDERTFEWEVKTQ